MRKFAFEREQLPEELNRALKERFGKGRAEMSLDELQAVLAFVTRAYDTLGSLPA